MKNVKAYVRTTLTAGLILAAAVLGGCSKSDAGSSAADTAAASSLKSKKPKKEHKPSDFKLGESVKVLSMNLTGTVSSLPDARGNLTVQMGILRSQVNISDLEIIEEPSSYGAKKMNRTSKGKIKMGKSLSVRPEINLLGRTVDEAKKKPFCGKYGVSRGSQRCRQ